MKITEQRVRYVADLANLQLTDDEISRMTQELGDILTHMEKLSELDTTHVEPMAQVLFETDEVAALREDREHEPLTNALALANAPVSGGGFYKVPKVIER